MVERRWAVLAVMALWSAAAGALLFGPDAGQQGDFLPLAFALAAVGILLATVNRARAAAPAEADTVWPFPPDPAPVSVATPVVMTTLGGAAGAVRRARVTKWAS